MVDLDIRRLMVELLAVVILAIGLSIAVEAATDHSGGFVTVGIAVFAVSTVEVAGWLWDAKQRKTETT